MTYLSPQQASSITTIGAEFNMAGEAFRGFTMPAGAKGFRIHFLDLDLSASSTRPILRFVDSGGLKATGYNARAFRKIQGVAYTRGNLLGVSDIAIDIGTVLSASGLIQGYFDGRLVDAAQNLWAITAMFRDDTANVDSVELYAHCTLASQMITAFVSSGNGLDWTAGSMGFQAWT